MRLLFAMVAVTGMTISGAQAATIVQMDSEGVQRGFDPFDTGLGRLDSAILSVVSGKSRGWRMVVPNSGSTTKSVNYVTKGFMDVNVNGIYTPFSAEGAGKITVDLVGSSDGNAYGFFATSQGGNISFDIGHDAAVSDRRIHVDVVDLGYYGDRSYESTFDTSTSGVAISHLSGYCGGGKYGGEDSCGGSTFKLTYNYTPKQLLGAVPEPSTWVMMILGFGAVGYSMRRRRAALRFA